MVKELITAKLETEYRDFLDDLRVNKTSFIRQAIRAHKRNEWKYVHKAKKE